MKKILYKVLAFLAVFFKIFGFKNLSVYTYKLALQLRGVIFMGNPNYIDFTAYIDPSGGLEFGNNIVISLNVIILTHDYSYTTGLTAVGKKPATDIATFSPVSIGEDSFIGAGSIILPGTHIGSNVIVGAGSVVKGVIEANSVVAGNPARKIAFTNEFAGRNESRKDELDFIVDKK